MHLKSGSYLDECIISYFKSAVPSEMCCVMEGALRINWDASHPLGSVGG